MAEPLTALATLGTVTNIIQVIDFSAQVVKQIHKVTSGAQDASEDVKRIEKLAEQYQKLNISICEHSEYSKPLTESEAAVNELASRSWTYANDLLKLVSGLKVKDSSRGIKRTLHGGAKVIKTAAQRHKFEEQEKNLKTLNDQLGTSFLHLLRQNLASLHLDTMARLDSLESQSDGTTKAILESKDEILRAVKSKRHQEESSVQKILDSLSFTNMGVRGSNIASAYPETYEWVFEDTDWGLCDWLSNDARLFWISGKAGAGKSTFMKFLFGHANTRRLLRSWAGDDILSIAQFYFWYLGKSKLQRSEEGLLRSILHQILSDCPYLVPNICSEERWRKAEHPKSEPWNREELYVMLDRLAAAGPILSNSSMGCNEVPNSQPSDNSLQSSHEISAKRRRFALFIDGLDEYTGDQLRLVRQIKRLANNRYFKICVSSRPENVFDMAFGGNRPSIRLEDLTAPDIRRFVSGNILDALSDSLFLNTHDDIRAEHFELIDQIVTKASGVFLWIFLVVNSVVRGIVEGDSIATLSKRVDAFPPDLHQYFRHTLNRVDSMYGQQTAYALLMAKAIVEDDSNRTLTGKCADNFVTYWLLRESEGRLPAHLKVAPQRISIATSRAMVHTTGKFLSACCKDLLQLRRDPVDCGSPLHDNRNQRVEFLHRAVYEFLCSDYMESLLAKQDARHLQDAQFWLQLAVKRLEFVPEPSQTCCDPTGCIPRCGCSYYYKEAHFIASNLKAFEEGGPRQRMTHDLTLSSELWLRLPCDRPPDHSNPLPLAKFLAHLRLNGLLLLLLRRNQLPSIDPDLVIELLQARFTPQGIDLSVLKASLDPEVEAGKTVQSILGPVCHLFLHSVANEAGIFQSMPSAKPYPLSPNTLAAISLLLQRGAIALDHYLELHSDFDLDFSSCEQIKVADLLRVIGIELDAVA